mgnify:CR=1 FL=1
MSRWPGKYVIGLTGNIATGKSIVRKMLEHLGAFGLDADKLAHQAMSPGAPAYMPVIQAFGQWIVGPDKKINRAALAKIVFTDPEALARLERITHPVVHQAIDVLLRRSSHKVAAIEAIKLLEAGYGEEVDAVWVVDAPPDVVVQRLVAKRNMTEAAARMYMRAQPPQQAKLDRAHVVIHNGGSLEDTWKQVYAAWAQLASGAGAPTRPETVTTVTVQPPAAPAAPAPGPAVKAPPPMMRITEVAVKRGTPGMAEDIAKVLSGFRGTEVTMLDVMIAFGEKAYLLAEANGQTVGMVGMLVENLIARVDEFYILPNVPPAPVIEGLVKAVEASARPLESEVAFFFIDNKLPDSIIEAFAAQGYELRQLEDVKVPAWREAAAESQPPNTRILAKKLRAERVLKPL